MGIEPTLAAWEAAVLPLNYTRARPDTLQRLNSTASCDRRQIDICQPAHAQDYLYAERLRRGILQREMASRHSAWLRLDTRSGNLRWGQHSIA